MNEIKKKQIAILGSTGSIGTQALQVIEEHSELYEVYALTAYNKVDLLIAQARKFLPEAVVIANEEKYVQLKEALSDLPVKVYAGTAALCQIVVRSYRRRTDSYGRLCRAEADHECHSCRKSDCACQQGDAGCCRRAD